MYAIPRMGHLEHTVLHFPQLQVYKSGKTSSISTNSSGKIRISINKQTMKNLNLLYAY